jgi:predicted GNAT superfamily acetyltransferase
MKYHIEKTNKGSENADLIQNRENVFRVDESTIPERLRPLLSKYVFRRATAEEITQSVEITNNAWPGASETQSHDLTARDMINAPMLGVFDNQGKMIGYSRLLWGYDNGGKPEILSHMTAVYNTVRDGGIGEVLKWQARQVALKFPQVPVEQLTVTFDNMQGRNCHVNINKLGMICGAAGGKFKPDAYTNTGVKQHMGNPADRYKARWWLNSEWTIAHLENRVKIISVEQARAIHQTLSYKIRSDGVVVPTSMQLNLNSQYLAIAAPMNWDELLEKDSKSGFNLVIEWRLKFREIVQNYHGKGYTTISLVTDAKNGINYHVMKKDFDPFNPPKELLEGSKE